MTTSGIRWLAGAERVTGAHPGGPMVGGPARMVHHITWDALSPRPTFGNVRDYLAGRYDPHLLVDPFTGRVAQFLPFDRSAYSLEHIGDVETNRQGAVCIQVEWYFTPGLVVAGKRYDTLADTPMRGLASVLGVARSWGIPDRWPAGMPNWRSARDTGLWLNAAGHYGHSQVPQNVHTDPGPLPPFTAPALRPAAPAVAAAWPSWWRPGTLLELGSTGAAVHGAQLLLGVTADGIFGRLTLRAVRAFQQQHRLHVDGVIGDNTMRALLGKGASK